jgi:hypothetical protein
MTDYVRRLVSGVIYFYVLVYSLCLHSRYIGPKARFKDPDLQLELDLVYLTDRVGLSWASY